MAALLRSARFLKLSPSSLLQITRSKPTGPPLGRHYGGAACGRWTGALHLHSRHVCEKTTSRVWPYAVGCVRSYAMTTERRDEASVAVRTQQVEEFDYALTKLDNSVRRTGRITKTLLLRVFHNLCRKGYPSGNQALLLLRSCGLLLPEVHQEERTKLVHHIWDKLQELGAQYDVSHYNALLKVYLQNEFKFSPTDFLAKMEAANIQPNRVTYQRLIGAYCQNGDIEGASTILGFMKSKDLPITEAVFSTLVTGHARAGDIESAKNILFVMRGAGIEPGAETYLSLLSAFAEIGDMENIKKGLKAAASTDCGLMNRDIMQVILTLARFGHAQLVPEMIEYLRLETGYIPDAINLCLNLITLGLEDTAFLILKTFSKLPSENASDGVNDIGNFFLRHCINIDTPLEKIVGYCKELQDSNMHSAPFSFTLYCALEAKKMGTSLELMKSFKEQSLPVRPHYFWPLLTHHMKEKNVAGVVEVMKGMVELSVTPDIMTISTYVYPAFPSTEAARQAIKDTGISLDSDHILLSDIRSMALNDLAGLYNLLSNPSNSLPGLGFFHNRLIAGFKKSSDLETMAKITKLLQHDIRFSSGKLKTSNPASYFLYKLIAGMTEEQLQAQEDKLRRFFSQLQAENVTISLNIFRGIKKLLTSNNAPGLIEDVMALCNQDTEDEESLPDLDQENGLDNRVSLLEMKLVELKAENKPLSDTLKQLIWVLCGEEKLQRALELKQQYEEGMTMPAYAILINLCCRHNNVEEAINLKREMSRMDPSAMLDTSKSLALVRTLATNNYVEEALDILKMMKEKDVVLSDANNDALFHMFNALKQKGDADTIRRLQETLFTLRLAKPISYLCSPLVTVYLDSNDFSGALDAALECQKRYKLLPRIHDVIVGLMENSDTDSLQKAMDFLSRERGEMMMLYSLFFAFVQTGRYREARKIIETPGLRARPEHLQWFSEKCIKSNQMEALEQMTDMTANLFECNRDEMYFNVLRLCKQTNNWKKAEAMWTKMQEENVLPRDRTLLLLADILKSNGQEVPFHVPEQGNIAAPEAAPVEAPAAVYTATSGFKSRVLILCKKKNAKEAYKVVKEAEKNGVVLDSSSFDIVIRALLAQGYIEDAMAIKDIAQSHDSNFKLSEIANNLLIVTHVKNGQGKVALEKLKSMFQSNQIPTKLAVSRLVQVLGSSGDIEGIQEVESLMKSLGTSLNLSSMLFVNNTALAHIQNGDIEGALELLEGIYTNQDGSKNSISFVFRKVLESGNNQALDKLSAMAERLANHFACYRPATDLFIELLENDKFEDAKFMLARINALAEQKEILLSFVAKMSRTPGQVGKIKNLMSLIPDFAKKEVLYTYLLKCHTMDEDLPSAKALHEQMQKEGITPDELSLKRLAKLYQQAGEPLPFPEPPESFRFYANKLKGKANDLAFTAEE